MKNWILILKFLSFAPGLILCLSAQDLNEESLSLEALALVPVVVSGETQSRLFDVPSNAYVFGKEALTYLPVDSLPELLRYAPGVHVVRPTNGNWGFGIHGMNSKWFGRTAFTVDDQAVDASIYSGLFGSQHDLIFADIASVEVIYGSGGVLWDNNGGSGTVNVVMKTAFETQGDVGEIRYGSHNRSLEGRSGWAIDSKSAIRVYGRIQDRQAADSGGSALEDDWQTIRVGTRYDLRWTSDDLLSLSADIHGSNLGYAGREPFSQEDLNAVPRSPFREDDEEFLGVNLQGKWVRQNVADTDFSLRSWASFSELDASYAAFEQSVWGVEGRSRTEYSNGHELVLSTGATLSSLRLEDTFISEFRSDKEIDATSHLGVQWTVPLSEERLELILSIVGRYESLGETFELSPSARLLYRPTESDRIWIAASRSARPLNSVAAYSEVLRGRTNPLVTPLPLANPRFHYYGVGNDDLANEETISYELGYRHRFGDSGEAGVTFFYHDYSDILGYRYKGAVLNPGDPFNPLDDYLEFRTQVENAADAYAYGFDAHLTWDFAEMWSATATYSYLHESFTTLIGNDPLDPLSGPNNEFFFELLSENSPQHIASLWFRGQLSEKWRMDLGLRYTDDYGSSNAGLTQDAIFQMDAGLTFEPSDSLRISLVGRNLLDGETNATLLKDDIGDSTEQEREWYLEVTYLF